MRSFQFILENRYITTGDIRNMKNEFLSGYSYAEISRLLKVKYDTVKKYLEADPDFEKMKQTNLMQREKLLALRPPPEPRPQKHHKIIDLIVDKYSSGQSENTIATELGVGRGTIRTILQNHPNYANIRAQHDQRVISYSDRARKDVGEFDEKAIADLYKAGHGEKSIADKYFTTIGIIRGILRRMPNYNELRAQHDSKMPVKNKLADPNIMKQFIDMYINGANIVQLSNKFGISRSFAWKVGKNLSPEIQNARNQKSGSNLTENVDVLQKQWLQKLANGPIDISPNGFSQEEKRILRPLYQRGLIVVDDKLGKKVLRLGRGNWYELATDSQKKILDKLEKSPGGFENLTYQSSGDDIYTSASSSFVNYEVAPGIRIISFKSLGKLLGGYDSPNDLKRINNLAEKIRETNSIAPLFIGLHGDGTLYIIEGQHRARALLKLGYDSVPGVVVVDMDSNEANIAENVDKNIDIKIVNDVDTSFRGGYGGTLIAKISDKPVGYLNYSIYRDVPHIDVISVIPEYRRYGIATKLLKELQKLSPDEEIDWGITTDLGSKLRGSINYIRRPNPEIIQKKRKLAGIKSKLAKLNYKLEKLQNTDIELARKFVSTVGDRWNKLNDLERKLENELYLSKGEYSKFIPEKIQ